MKKILFSLLLLGGLSSSLLNPALAKIDQKLAERSGCTACHSQTKGVMGPSYDEVYKKYSGDSAAKAYLFDKIKNGGSGVWGPVPMAPNLHIPDADIQLMVEQILQN